MHLNWRRGLFRCLVVLAVVGAGYAGLSWQKWSSRLEGDCWSRIAKWPDGQPFTEFDLFEQENTRANVELNKKRDVWAAESIVTRNQWVASTRQKLIACETGEPVELLQGQARSVWTNLRNSLLGLTIPPLAILVVVWMANGFRAQAHRQQAAEAVVPDLLNLQLRETCSCRCQSAGCRSSSTRTRGSASSTAASHRNAAARQSSP